jgi:hypothetical protein
MTEGTLSSPITYSWKDGPKIGLVVWILTISAEILGVLALLRAYPDSSVIVPLGLIAVIVTLPGGLAILLRQFEVSLDGEELLWRYKLLVGREQRTRRIARSEIQAFRIDKNPWTEQKLTVLLADGSALPIRGPAANVRPDHRFASFVASFRSFAAGNPQHVIEERANVWRSPMRRISIFAIVIASLALAGYSYSASSARRDLIIVSIAVFVAFQGSRFLWKRE